VGQPAWSRIRMESKIRNRIKSRIKIKRKKVVAYP
jgi:hypothetical protein